MALDDQLTGAFETLIERLRGDVARQVQQTSADVIAAARADRDRAAFVLESTALETAAAVAAARQEAHDEGFAAGRAAGRLDMAADAARQAVDAGSPDGLADALRAIERARSLTEVLDALVAGARTADARADVWLIRGEHLHHWRSRSDDTGDDQAPARPLAAGGLVADAVRMNAVAADDGSLAVPIGVAGQVVAILLADVGTEHAAARTQRLELMTRYAARCLEALTAFTVARALTRQPAAPKDPGPQSLNVEL